MRKYFHKPIKVTDIVDQKIYFFQSQNEIANKLGYCPASISKAKAEGRPLLGRYYIDDATMEEYIKAISGKEAT